MEILPAPQTNEVVTDNIHATMDEIVPQRCENDMENFIKRVLSSKKIRGYYMF